MLMIRGKPNRATLRAFSLTLGLLLGVVAAVSFRLLGSGLWLAWGAAVFAGLLSIGWLNSEAARRALDIWNRLARRVARGARLVLTATTFAILAVSGRAGNRLPWWPPRPGASGWVRRGPARTHTFESQSTVMTSDSRHWVVTLARWAVRSRNPWLLAVLPPLVLMSGIQLSTRRSLGGATYTLY